MTSREIFSRPGWRSSYGGKKWANIAEAGEFFWNGTVGAAVFVDRVFDLQHNGGRVFNKHPMVKGADYIITNQLDLKRQPLGVTEKVNKLLAIYPEVDDDIKALYDEGARKGVWKQ